MDKQTYDKPEPESERASRGWIILLLAVAVAALLIWVATQGYGP